MTGPVVYPHIIKPEGDVARLQSHPRTRVAMIVMDYRLRGMTVDEMCDAYEYLQPAEAYAAMAYYFDHREEIDREVEEELRLIEEERASRPPSTLGAILRARLAQKEVSTSAPPAGADVTG